VLKCRHGCENGRDLAFGHHVMSRLDMTSRGSYYGNKFIYRMVFFIPSPQKSITTMPIDSTSSISLQLTTNGSNQLQLSNRLSSRLFSSSWVVDYLFNSWLRCRLLLGAIDSAIYYHNESWLHSRSRPSSRLLIWAVFSVVDFHISSQPSLVNCM